VSPGCRCLMAQAAVESRTALFLRARFRRFLRRFKHRSGCGILAEPKSLELFMQLDALERLDQTRIENHLRSEAKRLGIVSGDVPALAARGFTHDASILRKLVLAANRSGIILQ